MSLARLVPRLSRARVVVVGDLVADEYVFGETERVSREAPVLIVRWESSVTKPGGAANVAANAAALGATVSVVGVVGRDDAGASLKAALEGLGADTSSVLLANGRRTETKTRILAGGRSTTRQQMLRVDRAEEVPLTPAQRKGLRARLAEAAGAADVVVVSDYGSGLFDDENILADLRKIAAKVPVCVDSRYGLRRFKGLTLAKPNEPELAAAGGGTMKSDTEVEAAGRRLLADLEAKALVVTRGRLGLDLLQASKPTVHEPVWGPAEAIDVTGAGDTVLATLGAALGAGASFVDAARLANVAGGIVVQKPGTATCSHEELIAAISGESR